MTGIIINPGSGTVPAVGDGWTNTAEAARAEAGRWLARIHEDGMTDVELLPDVITLPVTGRWVFTFRHAVTGVSVELETHGVDDLEAWRRQRVFDPRVYWAGSSAGSPCLDDFAAPGFVKTYRQVGGDES